MLIKRFFFITFIIFGLTAILLIYKYFDPLSFSFFPKCPVNYLTGLDCPGCGGQRAVHHLLNGNLKLAFSHNPLLFVLGPYMLLAVYFQLVPDPTKNELKARKILFGYHAIYSLLAIIIAFTILRNII